MMSYTQTKPTDTNTNIIYIFEFHWFQLFLLQFRNSLLCYALQEPISSKMCGRPAGIAFNEITGDLYVADALLGLHVVSPAGGLAVKIADGVDGKAFESLNGLDVDPTTGIVYFTSLSSQFSA